MHIPSTSQSSSRVLELSPKQVMSLRQYLTAVRGHFKGLNPIVTNALHIRDSVFLNWLKLHSNSQVQYMAGHKYLSGTEKYAAQEVEDLQDALARYHPFGQGL